MRIFPLGDVYADTRQLSERVLEGSRTYTTRRGGRKTFEMLMCWRGGGEQHGDFATPRPSASADVI